MSEGEEGPGYQLDPNKVDPNKKQTWGDWARAKVFGETPQEKVKREAAVLPIGNLDLNRVPFENLNNKLTKKAEVKDLKISRVSGRNVAENLAQTTTNVAVDVFAKHLNADKQVVAEELDIATRMVLRDINNVFTQIVISPDILRPPKYDSRGRLMVENRMPHYLSDELKDSEFAQLTPEERALAYQYFMIRLIDPPEPKKIDGEVKDTSDAIKVFSHNGIKVRDGVTKKLSESSIYKSKDSYGNETDSAVWAAEERLLIIQCIIDGIIAGPNPFGKIVIGEKRPSVEEYAFSAINKPRSVLVLDERSFLLVSKYLHDSGSKHTTSQKVVERMRNILLVKKPQLRPESREVVYGR